MKTILKEQTTRHKFTPFGARVPRVRHLRSAPDPSKYDVLDPRRAVDRCPDESMTDRAVWISAGRVKVIRKIRAEYERQNNRNALR